MNKNFKEKFRIEELTILNFDHWIVSVRPTQPTIGSLVISLKRNCSELSGISADEAKELSKVFAKTEKLLKSAFSYNKINYMALMMVDKHVHYHVIPRYEESVKLNNDSFSDSSWPGPIDIHNVIKSEGIELRVLNKLMEVKKKQRGVVGYTTGVYDLFHIGHLNILKHAKENCDYLIVGVTVDDLVSYKNKKHFIPFEERIEILRNIDFVDKVVPQENMNKMEAWERLHFDKMFVGSDWKGTEKWDKFEEEFAKVGVEIQYFPYTKGTSSTKLREALNKIRNL